MKLKDEELQGASIEKVPTPPQLSSSTHRLVIKGVPFWTKHRSLKCDSITSARVTMYIVFASSQSPPHTCVRSPLLSRAPTLASIRDPGHMTIPQASFAWNHESETRPPSPLVLPSRHKQEARVDAINCANRSTTLALLSQTRDSDLVA